MRKVAPTVESEVIAMIIEGALSYEQISARIGVAVSTVKKIRSRNKNTIERARRIDATQLPIDTLRMVEILMLSQLDRSQQDETILDELKASYRKGELSYREYAKQKRGLKVLTVTQLVVIAGYAEKRLRVS